MDYTTRSHNLELSLASTKRSIIGNIMFDYIQKSDLSELRRFIYGGGDITTKTPTKVTTLMLACGTGNFSCVKMILETNKVSITDKDHKGRNCLHHLCLGRHENADIFRLIQPRFLTQMRDDDGKLPLEYAIRLQLNLLTKLILEVDNNIDIKLCYDYGSVVTEKPTRANRYGFIVDETEKSQLFVLPPISKKKEKQHKLRMDKWRKMVASLRFGNEPKKFAHRLYKGMPDEFRTEVWKLLLFNPKEYAICSEEYKNNNVMYSKTPHDKQIDLDVNRTFSLHYKYSQRFCGGQKDLFYIMHSLVKRDPNLEYMQGITCAPAMLTLFLDAESAYTGAVTLLQKKHKLGEMFNGFALPQKCWNVTKSLLESRHPKLAEKLRQLDILNQPLPFFIFEWHYLWFIHAFPFELSLRIFDIILYDGFTALFVVADAIFHFLETDIINQINGNMLQQQLKQPFSIMKSPPTTNEFIEYMYKHQLKKDELLQHF